MFYPLFHSTILLDNEDSGHHGICHCLYKRKCLPLVQVGVNPSQSPQCSETRTTILATSRMRKDTCKVPRVQFFLLACCLKACSSSVEPKEEKYSEMWRPLSRRAGKTTISQPFPQLQVERWMESTHQQPDKGSSLVCSSKLRSVFIDLFCNSW